MTQYNDNATSDSQVGIATHLHIRADHPIHLKN